MTWEDMEESTKKEVKMACKRTNEKEWRKDMEGKISLRFYRRNKKTMGMSNNWNRMKSRRLRMFESGTVMTRSKTGGTDREKECRICKVEETVEHLLKDCEELKEARKVWKMEELEVDEILRHENVEMILEEVERRKMERETELGTVRPVV